MNKSSAFFFALLQLRPVNPQSEQRLLHMWHRISDRTQKVLPHQCRGVTPYKWGSLMRQIGPRRLSLLMVPQSATGEHTHSDSAAFCCSCKCSAEEVWTWGPELKNQRLFELPGREILSLAVRVLFRVPPPTECVKVKFSKLGDF